MKNLPKTRDTTAKRLKLVILNDRQQILKLLCEWLQRCGHDCVTARVADMPRAHTEVATFVSSVKPDVVIYDLGKPYSSSWDLLSVIRKLPFMKAQRFVVTTPNKSELDKAVGRDTPALEVVGQRADMVRLVLAVERAAAP